MKLGFIKFIFLCMLTSILYSQCNYDYGDTNDDDIINVVDIIYIVNHILEEENNFDENIDLNFDSIVNINDVMILVIRINDSFPLSMQIQNINFDFNELNIIWPESNDYGFESYTIYYNTLLNENNNMIYYTDIVSDTSLSLSNIQLNEQNWFWLVIEDFMGCELSSEQYYYELPYINYNLSESGDVLDDNFEVEHFQDAESCQGCHENQYNEWSLSMHSKSMHSSLFFSYKEEALINHPNVGDKFCSQCHNPVAYLTNTSLEEFNSVNDFQNSNLPPVIKDGIGCDICHTATGVSETIFTDESGAASALYKLFPGQNIKFGPISNPQENSFHQSYFLPTYESSNMCLPCHDLVIRDVEAEITFTEWDRIPGFSMFGGVSCQNCHMPEKEDGSHDHSFIGVDLDLNIPYYNNPRYYQVENMLSTAASIEFGFLNQTLADTIFSGDSLSIPIKVESLTAHNIPSGTSFNRDFWLEVIVHNQYDTLFSSGFLQNNMDYLDYNNSDLLYFKSFLIDEDGDTTRSVMDTDDIINNSLAPYSQRFKNYSVYIPENLNGHIEIICRLLFRPFDPQFIIQHDEGLINNIPIYEVDMINKFIIIE